MSDQERSDPELIGRAKAGDPQALEALFQRHYRAAFQVAFAVSSDLEWARELTEEAFVALYQQLSDLPEACNLGEWLARSVNEHYREQNRDLE